MEKRSSELIASSPPIHSRGVGLPPTAMMKFRDVKASTFPAPSVHSISFWPVNLPVVPIATAESVT